MNLAQQLKQRNERNRAQLLHLLELSEDDMSERVFEGAFEYLEKVFGTDAYGLKHLPNTSEFWTWWRMEWAKIDSIFLAAIEESEPESYEKNGIMYKVRDRDNVRGKWCVKTKIELTEWYLHYHEATMQNRYINSDIMQSGVDAIITAIKKREQEVSHA